MIRVIRGKLHYIVKSITTGWIEEVLHSQGMIPRKI